MKEDVPQYRRLSNDSCTCPRHKNNRDTNPIILLDKQEKIVFLVSSNIWRYKSANKCEQ
jgi:hypothetical protein